MFELEYIQYSLVFVFILTRGAPRGCSGEGGPGRSVEYSTVFCAVMYEKKDNDEAV
jgi:hypothetical protein